MSVFGEGGAFVSESSAPEYFVSESSGTEVSGGRKRWLVSKLLRIEQINDEVFSMDFAWGGPAPRPGQFFMVRPRRSSLFLGRPLSAARYDAAGLGFLVARRGKGTEELGAMGPGEEAELSGPLGNGWAPFLPPGGPVALVGGGLGMAPLAALSPELPPAGFVFYAGFRRAPRSRREEAAFLGAALSGGGRIVTAAEEGECPNRGRITDFFEPSGFRAVFACGPEPMLRAVADSCARSGTPCFVSLERRMACGTGACLGCAVPSRGGNRRCCADGPVFPSGEVFFDGP